MRNYFMLRKNYPHYFQSSTEVDMLIKTVLSQKIHCMLPYRDQFGRRIYVFRPGRWDPDKIPFVDLFCVGYMLCELVIREERTQIAGAVSITDASGILIRSPSWTCSAWGTCCVSWSSERRGHRL